MSEFFRLNAPETAPPEIQKYNGQIMSRFTFLDTDNLIGLAPLGGRPFEGAGIRVPAEWATPVTPRERAHAEWLDRTFFERERYVTIEEIDRILCNSCQGSGLCGLLEGRTILVARESRAELERSGVIVTDCEECKGCGITGTEADEILGGWPPKETVLMVCPRCQTDVAELVEKSGTPNRKGYRTKGRCTGCGTLFSEVWKDFESYDTVIETE